LPCFSVVDFSVSCVFVPLWRTLPVAESVVQSLRLLSPVRFRVFRAFRGSKLSVLCVSVPSVVSRYSLQKTRPADLAVWVFPCTITFCVSPPLVWRGGFSLFRPFSSPQRGGRPPVQDANRPEALAIPIGSPLLGGMPGDSSCPSGSGSKRIIMVDRNL